MNFKIVNELSHIIGALNERDRRLQQLREQLQEDIITICEGIDSKQVDALCQIVVDRFNELDAEYDDTPIRRHGRQMAADWSLRD